MNRTKVRRSRRKKSAIASNLFYSNINGFKGKSTSLKQILEKINSNIVVLCETKVANVNKIKQMMPQYDIIDRCIKLGKGGIVIATRKNIFGSFINVTSSKNENILVGRISVGIKSIRIIACYAPQETDLKEVREEFFEDVSIEVNKSRMSAEEFIIVGDLNSKLVVDKENTMINESPNGKLLLDFVKGQSLEVLNFSDKCCGDWTHVIRTTGQASRLDYILTTKEFYKQIDSMEIDETCLLCPFSLIRSKGQDIQQFSDHNSFTVQLRIPRGYKDKSITKNRKCWKITEEGLSLYHKITNDGEDQGIELPSVADDEDNYDALEEYMDTCMEKCFKSFIPRNRNENKVTGKYSKMISSLLKFYKKGKTQRKVVKMYIQTINNVNIEEVAELRSRRFAERLKQLSVDDKFSLDAFWKLKKSYVNKSSVLSSVENDLGVEVFGTTAIINEYRNEFMSRLSPVIMDEELKRFEEMTLEMSKLCVEMSGTVITPNFTEEELDAAIGQLKTGKSCPDNFPPEAFIYGGKELRNFILHVVNMVKNKQEIPPKWIIFKIVTLYKNKGSLKKLVNQRGIFLTPVISKIFEKLIKNRTSDKTAKVCLWQAGSRNNRSPADQTFLVRSAINHALYLNKPLFLTLYDFRQCFDKIWLEDALLSLWKLGVDDDMLKLISAMNERSEGTVKTTAGESESFKLGPNAKQGTVLGPILSSASIAECCEEQREGGAMIGSLSIRSLAYVDDLMGMNHTVRDVHQSHKGVVFFSRKKRVDLNEEKCVILPINVTDKDAIPVLYVNGRELDVVAVTKYLGDVFNSKGNNNDLIADRVNKGIACMVSSLALASEITLGAYLIKTLISLYKVIFVQVTTFNSRAWDNLTKLQISKLQTVQLKFLKRILHAPSSTTNCFTFMELGILPIEFNINIAQLNFLHHILTLDVSDPVHQAYNQQKLFEFEKNWYNEVKMLRRKFELQESEEEIMRMSKEKWNSIVADKVTKFAIDYLNNENSLKSKTSHHPRRTTLQTQEYFDYLCPADARLLFSIRSGTLDLKTLRRYRYDSEDTLCRLCEKEDETVDHIVNRCMELDRRTNITDVNSILREDIQEVVGRVKAFVTRIDEMEDDKPSEQLGN